MSRSEDVVGNVVIPNWIQCLVSSVSLYRLPSNVKLDSVDFEQCILDCVKNKLNELKSESGLSKKLISEIKLDLDSDSDSTLCLENKAISSNDQSSQAVVCIHANKLLWTILVDQIDLEAFRFDIRHHHTYLQTCFEDIKLCYVNFQLPNVIIWLLSCIPSKVVKNKPYTANCQGGSSQVNSSKSESLFALVWKCHNEHDVARLREVYKHLRSTKKLSMLEPSGHISDSVWPPSGVLCRGSGLTREWLFSSIKDYNDNSEPDITYKRGHQTDPHLYVMNQNRQVLVAQKPPTRYSQHILHRQRQPAKLIQENSQFIPNLIANVTMAERKSDKWSHLSHKRNNTNHAGGYSFSSESEFDTTQIGQYFKGKPRCSAKCDSNCRIRSRSVDTPRQRLRLSLKPANENAEIINSNCFVWDKSNLCKKNTSLCMKENELSHQRQAKICSDSLNSEGSSVSGESTSGEYGPSQIEEDCKVIADSTNKPAPIVVKSVLKKSSSYFDGQSMSGCHQANCVYFGSSSPNNRFSFGSERKKSHNSSRSYANCHKKNVTFSAYTTIQVMDN